MNDPFVSCPPLERRGEGKVDGQREKVLQNRQITFDFKLGDVGPVKVPLDLLVLDEFLEDVVAQCLPDQIASLKK